MDRINQFGLEPGVYEREGKKVVVVNIITEVYGDAGYERLEDPWVCYRPLESVLIHTSTAVKLSVFKTNFHFIV